MLIRPDIPTLNRPYLGPTSRLINCNVGCAPKDLRPAFLNWGLCRLPASRVIPLIHDASREAPIRCWGAQSRCQYQCMIDKQERAREYLRHAKKAEAEANKGESPEVAEGFRQIAIQWRDLARRTLISKRK